MWELIEQWEELRHGFSEAKDQANAATRWGLLLPITVLGVLALALVVILAVLPATPSVGDAEYGVLLGFGLPVLLLLVAAEVWLLRKMLAPRTDNREQRRELRRRAEQVKRQLKSASAQEHSDTRAASWSRSVAEITRELERTREEFVETGMESLGGGVRFRTAILAVFLVIPTFVAIAGIAVPIASRQFYGVVPMALFVLVLCVWAFISICRRAAEPGITASPRRRELSYTLQQLERAIARRDEDGTRLRRQPSRGAQGMWRRFAIFGPSPEKALAGLPPGAASVRFWFHRYVGWGPVTLLGYAVVAVVLGYFFGR